jgi:hypothetical protein
MNVIKMLYNTVSNTVFLIFLLAHCHWSSLFLLLSPTENKSPSICYSLRRCFIFLNPVKNPMFTRAIFIQSDSELIRESNCARAKLFVDEESTWHKSNRGRTNTFFNK